MGNIDDISNQLAKGLPTPVGQWTSSWISASATYSIMKSTAGILHTINIEMKSAPSLSVFDNSSGISGTLVARLDGGINEGNYLYDTTLANGLSVYVAAGNATSIRITYK